MRVIGTAGHVDHGKSTLVKALTGINPDRLEEEQRREMTIELGFAWMTLANGEDIGIIDVPGHRDFIDNMLAGVGGIDAVVFVVAADEGVMPQTREHLAILDILSIPSGVIALTKTDLIDDPEWLDLIEEDLRLAFEGTVLDKRPIIRVSAKSGHGLNELTAALETCLAETRPRPDLNRPRLPIDRIFTISGFGTVVTGTLLDGTLKTGHEVEVLPSGVKGRIRGLQTHKQKGDHSSPGSRTAVNVSGLEVDQVERGEVLTYPGDYDPTSRLDVHFRLLKDASIPIKHNMAVKFFTGAAETQARIRLLGTEVIQPGMVGWLQLELEMPVVAVRKDRYILRRPSPGETLGGGEVIDPHPGRRHKRYSKSILSRLAVLQKGTPEELLLQASRRLGAATRIDLSAQAGLTDEEFVVTVDSLINLGELLSLSASAVNIKDQLLISNFQWQNDSQQILGLLEEYHHKFPLRKGMPKEEIKSRLNIPAKIFNAKVNSWIAGEVIEEIEHYLRKPGHSITYSDRQKNLVADLIQKFKKSPFSPPTVKESQVFAGDEVYQSLIDTGVLMQLSSDVVFRKEDYEQLVAEVKNWLTQKGTITVAEFRDRFNTSRRYALALLEHLDRIKITIRDGDHRKIR